MILSYAIFFSVLTVFASLSPLLTFSRLWQIKEWRLDRLREHLRENGWFRQLLGTIRPLLTAILIVLSGVKILWAMDSAIVSLFALAVLSLFQMLLRHQRPVWTMKAKTLFFSSVLSIIIATFLLTVGVDTVAPEWNEAASIVLITLPLLSPFFIMLSWALLMPIDAYLKYHVLQRALKLRQAHPNLRVIGITGSVGKTTVKEMLSHVLKKSGALTTPERVNTDMGVAAWMTKILKNEPVNSDRILIVEMGAYRIGEIALLCRISKPNFGIITYIGNQHLSLFGSREAIIAAKGELFASLPETGHAFGNKDNDAYEVLKKKCVCPITSVGTDRHADVQALDIEETATGMRFKVRDTEFNVPVAGTHNVSSALLAIAAAQKFGMTLQDIAQTLRSLQQLHRTFELKTVGDVTVLDDTYNSSPDSVQAAIEWARKQPQQKKILVLEGIIELGDAEGRIHTELAELAAPVFTEAYAAHSRFLTYLRDGGFGERVSLAEERLLKAEKGSLVVMVGRLSPSIMARFI